jgi:hypothetical protein
MAQEKKCYLCCTCNFYKKKKIITAGRGCVSIYNSSTQEAEEGILWAWGQPGLNSEILSHKSKKQKQTIIILKRKEVAL